MQHPDDLAEPGYNYNLNFNRKGESRGLCVLGLVTTTVLTDITIQVNQSCGSCNLFRGFGLVNIVFDDLHRLTITTPRWTAAALPLWRYRFLAPPLPENPRKDSGDYVRLLPPFVSLLHDASTDQCPAVSHLRNGMPGNKLLRSCRVRSRRASMQLRQLQLQVAWNTPPME